jgi:glutaredoxin
MKQMTAVVAMLAIAARGTAFVVTKQRASVRFFASVSGPIYTSLECDPTIRLFTKEGCTLCDKVKDTLQSLREELPHSLEAVDITDVGHENWYEKYKYDIPVLHVGDQYWSKHRLSKEEAREGLTEARMGQFVVRKGEPDAGKMERRRAER